MAIISSGIGSGLDINSIVSQLVEVQKAPQAQRLDAREARLQARLSGYGTLQSAMAALQTSLIKLRFHDNFRAQSASVSDSTIIGATASSSAVGGVHQISVERLASAHRLVTDPALEAARFASEADVVGTGTLTFSFGATAVDEETGEYLSFSANSDRPAQSIVITDGSLRGIRDAINQAGIGVQASIVYDGAHYRLALASMETGAGNAMRITVEDGDGDSTDAGGLSLFAFNETAHHLQQTEAGRDTSGLVIDGIPITSASNTVRGAIDGVEIQLRSAGAATVTLASEDTAVVAAVTEFVDKYNALVSAANRLSGFNAETGVAGQLNGDSILRSAETQIRRVLGATMGGGDAAFRHLSEVGIRLNPDDGTLVLDEDRLRSALAQDRGAVANLFAGTPAGDGAAVGGYAIELDRVLGDLLGRGGIFRSATDGINDGIRDLARQRELIELRSIAYEERIRAQFTAMDALVAQLRSSSDFLMQQLDNLPPIGQRNNR